MHEGPRCRVVSAVTASPGFQRLPEFCIAPRLVKTIPFLLFSLEKADLLYPHEEIRFSKKVFLLPYNSLQSLK